MLAPLTLSKQSPRDPLHPPCLPQPAPHQKRLHPPQPSAASASISGSSKQLQSWRAYPAHHCTQNCWAGPHRQLTWARPTHYHTHSNYSIPTIGGYVKPTQETPLKHLTLGTWRFVLLNPTGNHLHKFTPSGRGEAELIYLVHRNNTESYTERGDKGICSKQRNKTKLQKTSK